MFGRVGNGGALYVYLYSCLYLCSYLCLYDRSNDHCKGLPSNGSECLAMEELCMCLSPLLTLNLLSVTVMGDDDENLHLCVSF